MENIKAYQIASAQGIVSMRNNANTKLLIHANEADTTAGTDIIDSSASAHTITATGNAQVDTDQAKFATGSVLFDGTGDYLSIDNHADWYMGTGNCTIDFWAMFNALPTEDTSLGLWHQRDDGANSASFFISNVGGDIGLGFTLRSAGNPTLSVNGDSDIVTGQWYHLALIRGLAGNANTWGVTKNGKIISASTTTVTWPDFDAAFEIGRNYVTDYTYFNGWIDEFRLVNDEAMWTINFTPPAGPYV